MSYDETFFNWLIKWAISKGLSEERAKEFATEFISLDKPTDSQIKQICEKHNIPYSLGIPEFSVTSRLNPKIYY